jgi:anti-anti-sigma factor
VTNPVASSELSDGTVRILPRGEIDLDNAYLIREAVDAALRKGAATKIVVDLSGVTLIDSVGIGVLVACYHAATAYRVPLEAAGPSTMVYRQLWVCGLVGLFGLATPGADAPTDPQDRVSVPQDRVSVPQDRVDH